MRVEIGFVGFDLYQSIIGNLYRDENLSNERIVKHVTISKIVNLFTTIGMCKIENSCKTDKHTLITVLYFLLGDLQTSLMIYIKAFVFLLKS